MFQEGIDHVADDLQELDCAAGGIHNFARLSELRAGDDIFYFLNIVLGQLEMMTRRWGGTDVLSDTLPTLHDPFLPGDLAFSVHKYPHLLFAGLGLSPMWWVDFGHLN